jgi:hypothetical protein
VGWGEGSGGWSSPGAVLVNPPTPLPGGGEETPQSCLALGRGPPKVGKAATPGSREVGVGVG